MQPQHVGASDVIHTQQQLAAFGILLVPPLQQQTTYVVLGNKLAALQKHWVYEQNNL